MPLGLAIIKVAYKCMSPVDVQNILRLTNTVSVFSSHFDAVSRVDMKEHLYLQACTVSNQYHQDSMQTIKTMHFINVFIKLFLFVCIGKSMFFGMISFKKSIIILLQKINYFLSLLFILYSPS